MFVKALYNNFVDVEGFYFLRCFYGVCKASRRLFDILPEFYIFEKKREGLFIENDCWSDLIRHVRYLTSFVHGKSEKDFMFATESYNL